VNTDDLGRVGLWTFAFEGQPAGAVREAAAELEELGYGALWFGEGLGRDSVSQSWLLLSATRRIVVAAGIANVAYRDPITMAAAERALGDAFPGRYVLGLGGQRVDAVAGVFDGYPMPPVGRPLAMMRGYLDSMDAVPNHGPAPDPAPPRVLAALGPKMLELAAERTWGAHPYFVPVAHTGQARKIMGPDAFLGVEQAVVLDTDLDRAREVATAHVAGYVEGAPHQAASVRRLGYEDGVTPGLVDDLVAHGDIEVIHDRVRQHLEAGADHVCLQVLTADPARLPMREWRELAPAVL